MNETIVHDPEISVIMGVYNQLNREDLLHAVYSILNQSFTDFEFIIYDDGSNETSREYLREIRELDERIILLRCEQNQGLAHALNECIQVSRGQYIARMDADDFSCENRLEEEVKFLKSHPEYSWCGCNAELFDESGVWGKRVFPEVPDKEDYLRFSPYMHPAVMFRRNNLVENNGYRISKETLRCEDYELFMRLYVNDLQGANIQLFLFQYREDKHSYEKRKMIYRMNETKIRFSYFKKLKIMFPKGWIYAIRPLVGGIVPDGLIRKLKQSESQNIN